MAILREGTIENQKTYGSLPFPKTFIPGDDCPRLSCLLRHIRENKESLTEQLHKHGALLFRGFPVQTAQDFNEFVEAFGWAEIPYKGRASRSHLVGRIWTANEGALGNEIPFHHEMSSYENFPTKVFFMCETAPPEGGQTAILQSYRVTEHMESFFTEFVNQIKEKGLLQTQFLDNGGNSGNFVHHSWQKNFGTNDPLEAERRASLEGWKIEWKGEEGVRLTKGPMEGIKAFEGYEGRKVWFNHIPLVMSKEVRDTLKLRLGDGSEIPEKVVEESRKIMNEECVDIAWEKGDVMLLDNLAVMHARRSSLPPRRVLAALCY